MKQTPIGIAMSGGVDSTACALILKRDYNVSGFLMDLGLPEFVQQKERLQRLGNAIGIDIHTVDLKKPFRERILDYFVRSYSLGKTPNPCAICNHEIKFGLFMDYITDAGFPLVATGHYARIENRTGDLCLRQGVDPHKDQSYFLARLTRQQLQRVVFPLGSMKKEDTYRLMERHGFTDFRGRESQDICFLSGSRPGPFLDRYLRDHSVEGAIVTTSGEEIGRHQGLYHYTIGQRRGLGLPDHSPWYVHTIDAGTNRLVVGKEDELFSTVVTARSSNWLCRPIPQPGTSYKVRTRSTHRGADAVVRKIDANGFELLFSEPQRALCPGQFVVLYEHDRVIGSGEIVSHQESPKHEHQ